MKKISIVFISLCLFVVACNQKGQKENGRYAELKKTQWLVGYWEQKLDSGILSERWEKVSDSTYQGASYFIKGKDTLHEEVMELSEKGGQVIFNATVQGQNNSRAVPLNLTAATAKQLVFENAAHEYPKKIVYLQINKDSISATISGIQQGKPSAENYRLTRK